MSRAIQSLMTVLAVIAWLAGIVLAKGFWWTTTASVLVVPAWYLVVERSMQMMGVLP